MAKYFSINEIACRCCGEIRTTKAFLILLDMIREEHGHPIIVSSWYRCANHNDRVGGVPNSLHLRGLAVDIPKRSNYQLESLVRLFRHKGFEVIEFQTYYHMELDHAKRQKELFTQNP